MHRLDVEQLHICMASENAALCFLPSISVSIGLSIDLSIDTFLLAKV